MGILSVAWYVGIKVVSENLFLDAVWAMGLMIAFYYGLTGSPAPSTTVTTLHSAKAFLLMGVVPVAGGLMLTAAFVKSVMDLSTPSIASRASPGSASARRW